MAFWKDTPFSDSLVKASIENVKKLNIVNNKIQNILNDPNIKFDIRI
jgi:hypothetical protein